MGRKDGGGGVRAGRPDTVRGRGPGCILGQEPWVHAHVLYNADRLICNAIMMSCPGHPLWRVVVELVQARWDSGKYRQRVLSLTGPKLLNDGVAVYGSNSGSGSVRVIDGGGAGGDSYRDGGAIMASDVVVMGPDTFYPHVDYANGDIKKKCRRRALDQSCNTTLSSHQCIRRRAACDVARGHNFTSPTPGRASFAAHHCEYGYGYTHSHYMPKGVFTPHTHARRASHPHPHSQPIPILTHTTQGRTRGSPALWERI